MQRNEIMQRIIDLETEMFMSVNAEEAVPANTIPYLHLRKCAV